MVVFALLCALSAPQFNPVPGQAATDSIEIHGVAAGEFNAAQWESHSLHFVADIREPLLAPRLSGTFRNIYAPSAVQTPEGWRVFYGAWDGVTTPNDRLYSLETRDFVDFGPRLTVIEHGAFTHVCNVNAFRNANGAFEMMCTAYPDAKGLNKPAYFWSANGATWNGDAAPHAASPRDLISIDGYDGFASADINGMSVIVRQGDLLWLYFNNFADRGKLFRAIGADGRRYKFDGLILDTPHYVNDVKRLESSNGSRYLMALHQNSGELWYALSRDGVVFDTEQQLGAHRGDFDRYIVAVGWVVRGNRVLGYLYGAGATPSLDRNRIFARWLQKRVVIVDSNGIRHEIEMAMGPDRQVVRLGDGFNDNACTVEVTGEDGTTQLGKIAGTHIQAGACYELEL